MERVRLVVVLRLLVRKNNGESNLISLVHNRTKACSHFARVEMQNAGNGPQIFLYAGQQLVGSFRVRGISPEYDNMREHNYFCESQWPNGSGGIWAVSG